MTAPVCKEATADCERQLAQQVNSQLALASNLGLPLGWNGITGLPACAPTIAGQACSDSRAFLTGALFVLTKILGLALTALATTLGAPFWFDLLNRLIQTRNVAAQAREAVDEISSRKRPPAKPVAEPKPEAESQSEPTNAANGDDSSDLDPGPNKPRTTRTPRRRRSSPRPPRTPAA